MEPSHTYTTFVPQLPGDILYLVGSFSTFESLSSLVQCSKWLYGIYYPLLFREIHLHLPTQIIKLDKNEKAMQMISGTKSLVLHDTVFGRESWGLDPNVFPDATVGHIIIRILRAMASLIQLEIAGRRVPKILSVIRNIKLRGVFHQFAQMLSARRDDPSFLPNLAIVNTFFTGILLGDLCRNRPVMYHRSLGFHRLHLDICPGLAQHDTGGRRIPEVTHSLSAQDIGSIIRKAEPTTIPSRTPTSTKTSTWSLIMRFPNEIRQHKPCPVIDTLSWALTMLTATGLPTNQLRSIDIRFEPPPSYQSPPAQLSAIEKLHGAFPSLEYANISFPRIKWSRKILHPLVSPSFGSSSSGSDLVWTVCPELEFPETLDWWFDAMSLGDLDAQNIEELEQKAKELWSVMSLRWGEYRIPSTEELMNHLRNFK